MKNNKNAQQQGIKRRPILEEIILQQERNHFFSFDYEVIVHPVIFIGMHRSGTSLLGRMLEELGLFLGYVKDSNNEARLFLELNKWLMRQCGARWDQPEPTNFLFDEHAEMLYETAAAQARLLFSPPLSAVYLGPRSLLKWKSVADSGSPWGWKDPRNTFMLPLWCDLFPNARVILIERHGVDVADSLRTRAHSAIAARSRSTSRMKSVAQAAWKRDNFFDSPRCLSLQRGFSLWETYQRQARKNAKHLPASYVLKIRYEELLRAPIPALREAADFCQLHATLEEIKAVTESIQTERAFFYRTKPELVDFARGLETRLGAFGYSSEGLIKSVKGKS